MSPQCSHGCEVGIAAFSPGLRTDRQKEKKREREREKERERESKRKKRESERAEYGTPPALPSSCRGRCEGASDASGKQKCLEAHLGPQFLEFASLRLCEDLSIDDSRTGETV